MNKECVSANYEEECKLLRKRIDELETEVKLKHIDNASLAEIKGRIKDLQYEHEKEKTEKRLRELEDKKKEIEEEIIWTNIAFNNYEKKYYEGE